MLSPLPLRQLSTQTWAEWMITKDFSWTELEMTDSFQESSRGHLDAGRGQLVGRSMPIKQARVGISHLF